MPLQNRVDPWGRLQAVDAKGTLLGNRGVLHNDRQEIVAPWRTKAWLTCRLAWKGRKRTVMSPGRYTELFFLDEATAFAAGHRPCFYCRRDDANRFRAAWEKGNGVADVLAPEIDAVLHRERFASGRKLHPLPMRLEKLPDGAMVQAGGESLLIVGGKPLRWSFAGYHRVEAPIEKAMLITPPSTVRALASGFQPVLHSSANWP